MILLLALAAVAPAPAAGAAEVIPPSPSPHYIVDDAAVMSPAAVADIDGQLESFERDTSNQIVVAIYPKVQTDDDIAAYSVRVFQAWKIGQKGRDNGVLLLISIQDHRMTIQVGYGLEGALPDATAKTIIDQEIAPRFKAGDYDGGIRAGVAAMIAATKGEYKGNGRVDGQRGVNTDDVALIVFFVLIFVLPLMSAMIRARRGTVYASDGSSYWWRVFTMLLRSGGGIQIGGANIGFGGGGGGGFGGGGGGGGFSGGGGSSGGGGASGSW